MGAAAFYEQHWPRLYLLIVDSSIFSIAAFVIESNMLSHEPWSPTERPFSLASSLAWLLASSITLSVKVAGLTTPPATPRHGRRAASAISACMQRQRTARWLGVTQRDRTLSGDEAAGEQAWVRASGRLVRRSLWPRPAGAARHDRV